jgi:hypothetical protein
VLIVDLPGMLREIVHDTVAAESDMEVAAEVTANAPIPDAAAESGAAVVILNEDHPALAEDGSRVLDSRQDSLKLLAVGVDGREGFLYALRPVRIPLGELSPARLAAAIRSDLAPGNGTESD